MSRGQQHLGAGPRRLQHHFLPSHQQMTSHGQLYRGETRAKTLYNGRQFNHNSYEASPSSFRYYSSSVQYLAGIIGADAATHVMFVFLLVYICSSAFVARDSSRYESIRFDGLTHLHIQIGLENSRAL